MTPTPQTDRGIYLLGNDAVLEWALACLGSLEVSGNRLPLMLIPYGGESGKLEAVVRRLGHAVLDEPGLLARLDAIAGALTQWPGLEGTYRKFAAFAGPFERFLLMDADVVVTGDLGAVIDAGADFDVFAAQHTGEGSVWRPGYRPEGASAHGVNGGIWCSRRGLVDIDRLETLARDAAVVRSGFASRGEQSFFNFWLTRDRPSWRVWNEVADAPECLWVGDLPAGDRATQQVPGGVVMVHWAGIELSQRMPLRRTWLDYRLAGSGPRERAAYLRREPLRAIAAQARRVSARGRRLVARLPLPVRPGPGDHR